MNDPSTKILALEPLVQSLQEKLAAAEARAAEQALDPKAQAALDRLALLAASASAPSAG